MDRKILKKLRLGDCIYASTYCGKPLYIDRITEYSVHCHTKNKTASYLINYEEIDSVESIQKQWKPTEEQMTALNLLLLKGKITEIWQAPCLQSLYKDLEHYSYER